MKNLKDIENLDLDMLEAIAEDKTIAVPESLQERTEATLLALQTAEEVKSEIQEEASAKKARRIRWSPLIGVAAAAAIAGFVVFTPTYPKDTYSNPEEAYAEIERTFAMMSQKVNQGMELAAKVEEPVATVNSVLNKI